MRTSAPCVLICPQNTLEQPECDRSPGAASSSSNTGEHGGYRSFPGIGVWFLKNSSQCLALTLLTSWMWGSNNDVRSWSLSAASSNSVRLRVCVCVCVNPDEAVDAERCWSLLWMWLAALSWAVCECEHVMQRSNTHLTEHVSVWHCECWCRAIFAIRIHN